MAPHVKSPSSWVYPDRDAWENLLHIRPKPRPVLEKPPWWRGPWSASRPGRPTEKADSAERKIELLRNELAWAQKCLSYAQSVLPQPKARAKAGRLADAIARACKSFDNTEKSAGMDRVVEELVGVGRHDPARKPQAFIQAVIDVSEA